MRRRTEDSPDDPKVCRGCELWDKDTWHKTLYGSADEEKKSKQDVGGGDGDGRS